jgi:outer membrane protein TolC
MNGKTTWCKFFALKPQTLIFAGLMTMTSALSAQESSQVVPPPQLLGGPLKLDTVAKLTLVNSSFIQSQSLQVEMSKSTLQYQKSTFDLSTTATLRRAQNRPYAYLGTTDADNQGLTLGLEQQFRSGIYSSFSVNLLRDVPTNNNPRTVNLNTSSIRFSVSVPLLKGRGYTSAAAAETAAQHTSDATIQSHYNAISRTLLAAIKAYWDYKAAVVNLKTYQTSQRRVLDWAEEANKGFKMTGKAPQFTPQIARLQAFLSDKERLVIGATDEVNQKRYALGTTMGITPDQVATIGEPIDGQISDFPMTANFAPEQAMQKWVAGALEKRFDLQAAKLTEQAGSVMLAKARRDILPQLDLKLDTGRTSFKYGNSFDNYTESLSEPGDSRGTDLSVSLNFKYPLGNNYAQSSLSSATVTHQQNLIQLNETLRTVRLEVVQSVSTLLSNLRTVEKTQEIVTQYESVLEEYKKSQPSLVTEPNALFNLMDIEKDLVAATFYRNQAVLELAKTIATLRHQTGMLIEVETSTNIASLKNITRLPEL